MAEVLNMVKFDFFLVLVGLLLLLSCEKLEENSIYHVSDENLPVVSMIKDSEIDEGLLVFFSTVEKSDPSKLLRYGHLWGHSSELTFSNNSYFDFSEFDYSDVQVDPIKFETTTINFDRNQKLFYRAYAINENGINYSLVQPLCSSVYFDYYEIIEEDNNDNKINPGETVKLRFFLKNESIINSVNTKITEVVNFSSFINYIDPFVDIPVNFINYENSSYIDLEISLTNGASQFIELRFFMVDDCNPNDIDLKGKTGDDIRIEID